MTTSTISASDFGPEPIAEEIAEAERLAELLAARNAIEAGAAKDLQKLGKTLTGSRAAAASAVNAAQSALLAMVVAIDDHNRVIAAAAADLADRGLPQRDEAGEHQTGAAERYALRLDGSWWTGINAAIVYERTVNLARRAAFSRVKNSVTTSTLPAAFTDLIAVLPVAAPEPRQSWGRQVPSNSPPMTDRERQEALESLKVQTVTLKPGLLRQDGQR